MGRSSVQINIRASSAVAEALREEADRRGLSLGATLEALLEAAREGRSKGTWLSLPRETEAALRAVAGARGVEPEVLLAELTAGLLRRQLLDLAAGLPGGAARAGRQPGSEGRDGRQGAAPPAEAARARAATAPPARESARPAAPAPAPGERDEDAAPTWEDGDDDVGVFTVFD